MNEEKDKTEQQTQASNNNIASAKERVLSTDPRGSGKNEPLLTAEAHYRVIWKDNYFDVIMKM